MTEKIIIRSEVDPNIYAQVLADSINSEHDRITSFHVHYPRIVLAELNTHKIIQKNSSSSRAIPTNKELNLITQEPFVPSFWGKNQAGMQARESLSEEDSKQAELIWRQIIKYVSGKVKKFNKLGLHKQITNRWLEPAQYMNTVLTATEWDNFLYLRNHDDAEPHLHELAKCISIALDKSKPQLLNPGEWHLPFIETKRNVDGVLEYFAEDKQLTLEEAKKISASCCAQISYRKCDTSLEKADNIFDKLINSDPPHCYIEGTKVLTKKGFKDFNEIDYSDEIADIDKNTLKFMGWKHPINIIHRHLKPDEKIYYYNNLKLGVTDKHTMIGSVISTYKDRHNLDNLSCFRPGDIGVNKGTKSTMGERECNIPNKCSVSDVTSIDDYNFGKLLGFYISDGFMVSNVVHFRLVKDRKIKFLTNLLNDLNIEFKTTKRNNDVTVKGNQVSEFTFYYNNTYLTKECGEGANNKKIPDIAYENMDTLKGIFEGLENGDGHRKGNKYAYFTTSVLLANQVSALSTLVGKSAKINKKQNNCFKVTFNSRNYHKINDTRKMESIVNIIDNYDNKVHCVEMESGAVVIQTENNTTLISGNCSPAEHQGTPIDYLLLNEKHDWRDTIGITHMDRTYSLWSAGFKGWIQYRKELEHIIKYGI